MTEDAKKPTSSNDIVWNKLDCMQKSLTNLESTLDYIKKRGEENSGSQEPQATAPALATAEDTPANGFAVSTLMSEFGLDKNNTSIDDLAKAIKTDKKAPSKLQKATKEVDNQLVEQMRLTQQQTMQGEHTFTQKLRALWRPTFGFTYAACILIQFSALTSSFEHLVIHPENTKDVMEALKTVADPLSTLNLTCCAVLGVQVFGRSQEKIKGVTSGSSSDGIVSSLIKKLLK